jgi:hypothetical protein
MTQRLRVKTVPAENWIQSLISMSSGSQPPATPAPGNPLLAFKNPQPHANTHAYTHTHTHTHTHHYHHHYYHHHHQQHFFKPTNIRARYGGVCLLIPVFGKQRQDDLYEFEASLANKASSQTNYIEKPCLKKAKNQK